MNTPNNKNRRSGFDASHVRFYKPHMQCPAFRLLPSPAVHLLVILYEMHDGTNNGKIRCGVRKAAALMNRSINGALRYFGVLQDMGWIRPSKPGSFTRKDRTETEWILTEYPVGDQLATKDFLLWGPAESRRRVADKKKSTVSKKSTDGIGNENHGIEKGNRDGIEKGNRGADGIEKGNRDGIENEDTIKYLPLPRGVR